MIEETMGRPFDTASRKMTMKRIKLFIALMLLLTAVPWSALAAEQTYGTKAPKPVQQKEQYKKGMEERLRKIGKELNEFKTKAAAMP
jgi:hypothetical protein